MAGTVGTPGGQTAAGTAHTGLSSGAHTAEPGAEHQPKQRLVGAPALPVDSPIAAPHGSTALVLATDARNYLLRPPHRAIPVAAVVHAGVTGISDRHGISSNQTENNSPFNPAAPNPESAFIDGAKTLATTTDKAGKITSGAVFAAPPLENQTKVENAIDFHKSAYHIGAHVEPVYLRNLSDFRTYMADHAGQEWLCVIGNPNLNTGVIIIDNQLHVTHVRPRETLVLDEPPLTPEGYYDLTQIKFGRPQSLKDIDRSILVANDEELFAKLEAIYNEFTTPTGTGGRLHSEGILHGMFKVGPEYERAVRHKESGAPIANVQGEELLESTWETAAIATSTVTKAMLLAAKDRLSVERLFPEANIEDSGTPSCGTLEATLFNVRPELDNPERVSTSKAHGSVNVNGRYVYNTVGRYLNFRPPYFPSTEEGLEFRAQLALERGLVNADGHPDVEALVKRFGHTLWVPHAGHLSLNIGNFQNSKGEVRGPMEMAVNVANLFVSFGVLVRMFMSTGPYCQGHILNYRGKPVLSARDCLRNEMMTATAVRPIDGIYGYINNLITNLTRGGHGADRMDRASFEGLLNFSDILNAIDSEGIVSEHGDARIRAARLGPSRHSSKTNTGLDGHSARVEYTGADASEIFMNARSQKILKLLGFLALEQTIKRREGYEAMDHQARQYFGPSSSWQDVFVDAMHLMQEFRRHGVRSPDVSHFLEKWDVTLDQLDRHGGLKESVAIARAGISTLRREGAFEDLGRGLTIQGHATVDLANQGLNGLQVSHYLHKFGHDQALWLVQSSDQEKMAVLLGEEGAGFEFIPPDVTRYSDEAIAERSLSAITQAPSDF